MGDEENTPIGTNISYLKALLKVVFLFPRWDMLVPWKLNELQEDFIDTVSESIR